MSNIIDKDGTRYKQGRHGIIFRQSADGDWLRTTKTPSELGFPTIYQPTRGETTRARRTPRPVWHFCHYCQKDRKTAQKRPGFHKAVCEECKNVIGQARHQRRILDMAD